MNVISFNPDTLLSLCSNVFIIFCFKLNFVLIASSWLLRLFLFVNLAISFPLVLLICLSRSLLNTPPEFLKVLVFYIFIKRKTTLFELKLNEITVKILHFALFKIRQYFWIYSDMSGDTAFFIFRNSKSKK